MSINISHMEPETILGGSFKKLNTIHYGSYSNSHRVLRRADQQHYVAKQFRLDCLNTLQFGRALTEMRILASISSPFVPVFRHAFVDKNWKSFVIIRQQEGATRLRKLINQSKSSGKHFPQSQIWKMTAHLCSTVALLHKHGIIHRDIQPDEIAKNGSGNYQITDFTVASILTENKEKIQIGTPYYQPPQIWNDQPYGPQRDIWSLGCTIYDMCTWTLPFVAEDFNELSQKIKEGVYQTQIPNYSDDLSALVAECLSVKPEARPSAVQLLAKIQKILETHPEYGVIIPNNIGTLDLIKRVQYEHNNKEWEKAEKLDLPQPRYEIQEEVKPQPVKKGEEEYSAVLQIGNPTEKLKQFKIVFTKPQPKQQNA